MYGELLGALEGPLHELFAFEGGADELLDVLDDGGGPGLAGLVDYRGATGGAAEGSAADTAA